MGLKLHKKYCSYYPALVLALNNVDGDVLELGAGSFSTFFLHWLCLEQDRKLVTYENDKAYYDMVKHCQSEYHDVIFIDNWDDMDLRRSWGIALVDHAPAIRRKEDIKKLANYAQCVIAHDTQGRANKHYRYDEIIPLFKFRVGFPKLLPQSLIFSNFMDVTKWTYRS